MGPHPNVWVVIQGFIQNEADTGWQIMSNAADLDLREKIGRKRLGEQTREQIKSKPIGRSRLTFSARSNLICGCIQKQFVFLLEYF